jgi:hypothetical protein
MHVFMWVMKKCKSFMRSLRVEHDERMQKTLVSTTHMDTHISLHYLEVTCGPSSTLHQVVQ